LKIELLKGSPNERGHAVKEKLEQLSTMNIHHSSFVCRSIL
jgi:hypothetical protein